jgi:serine O-acetyltransferase
MSNFNCSLSIAELNVYLNKQLNSFFPDSNMNQHLFKYIGSSLERIEYCFSRIKSKYYNNGNETNFNHLNGDHYSVFLYFVSNEAFKDGNNIVYQKCSLLNKSLFSIDLFGHIEMPSIFLLVHPVGTIIGRAILNDYLVIYQGVTIGGVKRELEINYPTIGKNVVCYSNSSILGNTIIGDSVIIGANTMLIDEKVDGFCTVVRERSQKKLIPLKTSHSNKWFF